MASVNEMIVREFFESLGFLVNQPRKYQVMARAKQAEEEVDFVVFNPQGGAVELPAFDVWGAAELRQIMRAVVGVRGWHSERFSPAKLTLEKELFRLADSVVMQPAGREQGKYLFEAAAVPCASSGLHGYTVRVLPRHPDLANPFLPGLITWADGARTGAQSAG